MKPTLFPTLGMALVLAMAACGGGDAPADATPDAVVDVPGDPGTDPGADVPVPDDPGVPPDAPADPGPGEDAADDPGPADVPADVATDAPTDADDPFDIEVVTTPGGLPWSLPFRLERPDAGGELPASPADFAAEVTGFWKEVDYFRWVAETSAGVDASSGYPDYLIWWHDFRAIKAGDTVTFVASARDGGSHNNAEPTGVVLANALVAHLALRAGDEIVPGSLVETEAQRVLESVRYLAEQYTKSFPACQRGFLYDADDTVDWLFARNIAPVFDQSFTLPWAPERKKAVQYDEWFFPYTGWNADRFFYPDHPIWGPVWVTNKRSKDDLPYLWRVGAWLPYVIELTPDPALRAAAEDALDLLRKGAKDIVDSGWLIRTKDENGDIYVPESEDLASFVAYTGIIPDAECDGRLSTALLGYGDPRDVDCGTGQGSLYDQFAAQGHYFNYDIINHFHQAAALLALTTGHAAVARELVRGLGLRADRYLDPAVDAEAEPGKKEASWERDVALFLLRSAALGLPLTMREAALVQQYHLSTLQPEDYGAFPYWDLWDASVPDGEYSFRSSAPPSFHPPSGPEVLRAEDMASLVEYCGSPFRNPAGAQFVDCDIVLEVARWGEAE